MRMIELKISSEIKPPLESRDVKKEAWETDKWDDLAGKLDFLLKFPKRDI